MNLAKEEAARLRLRIHEMEKVGNGYESRIEGLNKKVADLESQVCQHLICLVGAFNWILSFTKFSNLFSEKHHYDVYFSCVLCVMIAMFASLSVTSALWSFREKLIVY